MALQGAEYTALGHTNSITGFWSPPARPFEADRARAFFGASRMPCAHAQTDLFRCRRSPAWYPAQRNSHSPEDAVLCLSYHSLA